MTSVDDSGVAVGELSGRLRFRGPGKGSFVEGDLLGRRGQSEALARLLRDTETPACVAVSGPFGSGKSFLLEMVGELLRMDAADSVVVAEANLFLGSVTGAPLLDLIGCISEAMGGDSRSEKAMAVLRVSALALVRAVPMVGKLAAEVYETVTGSGSAGSWEAADNAVKTFRRNLEDCVPDGGRLILLVDEMDRCDPDYAIQCLRLIRGHLNVPGVIVVCAVTDDLIEGAVREVHRIEEGTVTEYLGKFFDYRIELRAPALDDTIAWLKASAAALPALGRWLRNETAAAQRRFPLGVGTWSLWIAVAAMLHGRHRDMQQFLVALDTTAATADLPESALCPPDIAAALLCRHAAPDIYSHLAADRPEPYKHVAEWGIRLDKAMRRWRNHLTVDTAAAQRAMIVALVVPLTAGSLGADPEHIASNLQSGGYNMSDETSKIGHEAAHMKTFFDDASRLPGLGSRSHPKIAELLDLGGR